MPTVDRAEYLISARDFEAAFDLLLATLGRSDAPGISRDRVAKLALQIAVQFKQSPRRAGEVVQAILDNPASPRYLSERARGWKRSIDDWNGEKATPDTLFHLRKLVDGRATDIEPLRALPRVLARLAAGGKPAETAELLRLAGQCYEAIDEVSTLGLAQNYYEACVRAHPHSVAARTCYSKLESLVFSGYTGTAGTHVPGDVRRELDELRALAE